MYKNYYLKKLAELDLPDLKVNPKNKITRLIKDLDWGLRLNGDVVTNATLHGLPDDVKAEIIGRDEMLKRRIATCVDKANYVVDNVPGVGLLGTQRSDMKTMHIVPLFKHKGKYYFVHRKKYSKPHDTIEEIGTNWWKKPKPEDIVPEYMDVLAANPGTRIDSTDLREAVKEMLAKSVKKNRVYYKK